MKLSQCAKKGKRLKGTPYSAPNRLSATSRLLCFLGDDVVYNDGTPCLKTTLLTYITKRAEAFWGVQTVPHENICKYGCVDGEKLGDRLYSVKDMIEKPKPEEAPTDVGVLGRYVITPEIF